MHKFIISLIFLLCCMQNAFSDTEEVSQSLAPLSCIGAKFSSSMSGKTHMNSLEVKNNCSYNVDFKDSKLTWESPTAVKTNFWGNFSSISYPKRNTLRILSNAIGTNKYLATINLKFNAQGATKLAPGRSFTIKWISSNLSYTNATFKAQVITTPPSTPPVGTTPVQKNGQLTVCGTKLCNEHGNAIQLKGVSSHGLQWLGVGDCLTEASLDYLVNNAKANVFRIAMYVQSGGYETNPEKFTQDVNYLINAAYKRGIYVIADFHILTPGNPFHNLDRAKKFFTDIANANKNKNNLIYEIANEPNGVNWFTVKGYAEQVIPVIRAIDNKAPIIVGTPGWSSLGIADGRNAQDIIDNPLKFPNILYAFHFYAASHHDDYHLNELDRASNILPIFASEFGTQTYTGDGENDFNMTDKYMNLMARKKISWVNWNYSDSTQSSGWFKPGTCPAGAWVDSQLKPAAIYIKNKIIN